VKVAFDRDTRRHWIDLAMSLAALACVVIAIIPLGSILIEASLRDSIPFSGPPHLDDCQGGIGNASKGR